MQRSVIAIGAGLVIALAGLSAWALSARVEAEQRADEIARQLSAATERSDQLEQELATKEASAEAASKKARATTRQLAAAHRTLSIRRIQLRRLTDLGEALTPEGGDLGKVRLVRGPDHSLLVLQWDRYDRTGVASARSGIHVWRLTGQPPTASSWSSERWELIYSMDPDPTTEIMLVGPPGSQRRESSDATAAWLSAVGDVTGDEARDLVMQQWNTGSGGCGVVRALENSSSGLVEIFRREGCDHSIRLRSGEVGYREAIFPKGCESAHGCGYKRTWMRWNGSTWVITRVKRKLY